MSNQAELKTTEILRIPIAALTKSQVLNLIEQWVEEGESRYICLCDVHSLMRAQDDPEHLLALQNADLVLPDGQPLVWTAKLRGIADIERVPGPDLLPLLCERSIRTGWRHYFYGGADGVAQKLADNLQGRFPGLQVAGTTTPPFRPLTKQEDDASIGHMSETQSQIVWIGLGCPKQERWMLDHAGRMPGTIVIGVGAAFDFHCGHVKRAPHWMRDNGLEWLHRLLSEPRRLWRRYLWHAPRFAFASLAETLVRRTSQ